MFLPLPLVFDGDDAYIQGTWTKVGIQSIYYGGGVCNKSSVVWAETPAGISDMTMDNKPSKTLIFNVAGQRLAAPQKGLNIINGRKVLIK